MVTAWDTLTPHSLRHSEAVSRVSSELKKVVAAVGLENCVSWNNSWRFDSTRQHTTDLHLGLKYLSIDV